MIKAFESFQLDTDCDGREILKFHFDILSIDIKKLLLQCVFWAHLFSKEMESFTSARSYNVDLELGSFLFFDLSTDFKVVMSSDQEESVVDEHQILPCPQSKDSYKIMFQLHARICDE